MDFFDQSKVCVCLDEGRGRGAVPGVVDVVTVRLILLPTVCQLYMCQLSHASKLLHVQIQLNSSESFQNVPGKEKW